MSDRFNYAEIVNASATRLSNAVANDFVFWGDSSNQNTNIGVQKGSNAALQLRQSNISIDSNATATTPSILQPNIIKVTMSPPVNTYSTPTLSAIIPQQAWYVNTGSNSYFLLSNTQTDYRFVNTVAVGTPSIRITPCNQIQANSNDTSNVPSYTWVGDPTTGMYHASNYTIGFATGGGPVMTINSNAVIVTSNIAADNIGIFRNKLLNGNMRIAQRGTSFVIGAGNSNNYTLDQYLLSSYITTGAVTIAQQTLTTTDAPYTSNNITNSIRVTATTALSSYSNVGLQQVIEGYTAADLCWGSPYGQPVTLSCWVRTNAATSSVLTMAIRNFRDTHTYPFNITVASSTAWQYVSKTIPAPPSTSVWDAGSNGSIRVFLIGYDGTGTGTADTWGVNSYYRTSATTNVFSTLNNYVEVAGAQLEKGNISTPFEIRTHTVEIMLCQRYYYRRYNETLYDRFGFYTADSSTIAYGQMMLPTRMRVPPTMNVSSATDFANLPGASMSTDSNSCSSYFGIFKITTTGLTACNVGLLTVGNKTANTVWMDFSSELALDTTSYTPITTFSPYWYYNFNGTLTESVSGTNNATNTGTAITYTVGRKGSCIYLAANTPSTNAVQSVGATGANLYGNMSISMWVNIQGMPNTDPIGMVNVILYMAPFKLYVQNNSGTYNFSVTILTNTWFGFTSVATATLNNWTHLALTYAESGGNGTARLYINGVLDTTYNTTGLTSQYNGFTIGTDGLTRAYKGMIDELMVFNRTLTGAEVQSIFYA